MIKSNFLLSGVDGNALLDKYISGCTASITQPYSPKIQLSNISSFDYDIGSNKYSDVYERRDANQDKTRIFTTNTSNFMAVYPNIEKSSDSKYETHVISLNVENKTVSDDESKIECPVCKDTFMSCKGVGIPFELIHAPYTYSNGDTKDIVYAHIERKYCSFECAYYTVKIKKSSGYKFGDMVWKKAENNLHLLYDHIYPDAGVLRSSPDPDLLISNGGSLRLDDYKSNTHEYIQLADVITIPSKRKFKQQILHENK